jgi:hypothetical protein
VAAAWQHPKPRARDRRHDVLRDGERDEVVFAVEHQRRHVELEEPCEEVEVLAAPRLFVESILDCTSQQDRLRREVNPQAADDLVHVLGPVERGLVVEPVVRSLGGDVALPEGVGRSERRHRLHVRRRPAAGPEAAQEEPVLVRAGRRVHEDQVRDAVGMTTGVRHRRHTSPRVAEQGDRLRAEVSADRVEVLELRLQRHVLRPHALGRPSTSPLVVVDEPK